MVPISAGASGGGVWRSGGRGKDEAVQLLALARGYQPLVELLLHQGLELMLLLPVKTRQPEGAVNDLAPMLYWYHQLLKRHRLHESH